MLGLAAKHRSDPIRAFTLTFDRAGYDEGAIAREMAAQAQAEFHPIPIGKPTSPTTSPMTGRLRRFASMRTA